MTANFMSTGFRVLWSVLLLDEPTSLAMAARGDLIIVARLLVSNLDPLRALKRAASIRGELRLKNINQNQ